MRYITLKSITFTLTICLMAALTITYFDSEVKADAAVKPALQGELLRSVSISTDKVIKVSEELKNNQENGEYGGKNSSLSRGESGSTDIISLAYKFMGKPYVWGSAGPSAFDCSGFTAYLYSKYGIYLPHSAASQKDMGTAVNRNNLRAGDLVFFNTYMNPGHVGMYIGGGRFIHASSGSHKVTTSSLDENYYSSRYAGARRYIK